ncbi:MAG: CCA tRNA nucleotidyltransferase [Acidimicrobiia bacterium]|nr:CCA tRNA nucleotidyltransferase [Acidimicrobiia bacterium]MDH3462780.1 CCA tRNA nucleotidyltransferase [Acidimicrobiia bacterium]
MIPDRLQFLVDPDGIPAQLAGLFAAAGFDLYLVGGSVRDAFLERPIEDLDFTTSARPDDIAKVLEPWADSVFRVGELFGTIAALKDGLSIEVTTFRDEVYRDESRKPSVTFSDDVETDLARRDFTVNAIAVRLPEVETVDPHGGLVDLAQRRLRTPMDPEVSFSDDPLRMLRLFRFQASLGFEADPLAVAAVDRMADRLSIVSAERIRDELSKLLLAPAPGETLASIVAAGLTEFFIPELSALAMEQDPHHRHKDVLAHTFAVVDKASPDLVLRLAALLHDVGKPATREFGSGGVTFHHHEVVGSRMARNRLRALKFPKDVVEDVVQLVFLHLRPHTLKMGWTDSAVRRYVRDAGPLIDRLNELVRCDVTTANEKRERAIQNRIDELEARIEELAEKEELSKLRPPIDGNDVMALLGIEPGPLVGEIMRMLLEIRIEDGPYTEEEARQIVRKWADERGL